MGVVVHDNIIVGFVRNEMHILIDSLNKFEPTLFKPINERLINDMHEDACVIKDIINILELEEDDNNLALVQDENVNQLKES